MTLFGDTSNEHRWTQESMPWNGDCHGSSLQRLRCHGGPSWHSVHGSCAVHFRKAGGLYLRSPGNKVHAVCKMHQIIFVRGSLGEKWLRNYIISRQGPDFVLFYSFLYWSLQCHFALFFFAGRNAAGCSKKCFL